MVIITHISIICLILLIITVVLTPYRTLLEHFNNVSADCQVQMSNMKLERNNVVNQCYTEKQNIQSLLDSKTTEITNIKGTVSDCNKQRNEIQMSYDKLSGEYRKLMNQMIFQQKNTTSTNNQITMLQDNLTRCQQQINDNTKQSVDITNQYNQLVKQYQDLQSAYKNLFEEYNIKCYDYHISKQMLKNPK